MAKQVADAVTDTFDLGSGQPLDALVKVQPEYPQLAREAGVDGTVWLRVLVGGDGLVHEVQVVRSIPMLDGAAKDAVRHWQFAPLVRQGKKRAAWMKVPIQFSLH